MPEAFTSALLEISVGVHSKTLVYKTNVFIYEPG